jgi:hypothetical protein
MNSIAKVNSRLIVDIVMIKALAHDTESGCIYIYFVADKNPLIAACDYSDFMNLYTKWKNFTQWRMEIMTGESD